jgi:hypothetical protein
MKQTVRIKEKMAGCLLLNIYLIAGVSMMVCTIFYLLFHLQNSDKIVYLCIPGFAAGISAVILYGYLSTGKTKIRQRINKYGK